MKRITKLVVFGLLMAVPFLSWAGSYYYQEIDSIIDSQRNQLQTMFNSLHAGYAGAEMPTAYTTDLWLVLQERYGFSSAEASYMTGDVMSNSYSEFERRWSERYPLLPPAAPSSPATQVQLSTFQTAVFVKTEPVAVASGAKAGTQTTTDVEAQATKAAGGTGRGIMKVVGTDLSLNLWKYDGGPKGRTVGMNPGMSFGEDSQFSFNVPLYQTDIWHLDKEILTYGVDGKFKQKITDYFALGMHGNFLQTYYGMGLPDKREASFSLGPFASFLVPLSDRLNLSFGGMLDYTDPEWSKEVWTGSLGANLGIKILDNLVTNPYCVYFRDLDRAKDGVDNDFWDVGIELKALMGASWSFVVGTKTTMGFVGFKAYEYYVGTSKQW